MICEKNKCTGCGACFNVCPKKCITMVYDNEGFLVPEIDSKVCVECNLCRKVCPSITPVSRKNMSSPKTYGGYYKNSEDVINSSSGGIFTAISKYIFSENGVVFGAVMNPDLSVEHVMASNMEECIKMRGSKYVQSDIKKTYTQVKEVLKTGKTVFFVGCGCQIAGLYSYLGNDKNIDKLVTADLICHGAASKKLFDKYIKEKEEKYKDKITKISFRNKRSGWRIYTSKIDFESGASRYVKATNDPYMITYIKEAIYRESCYTCEYAKLPRVGDITLGDFIGIDKTLFNKEEYFNGISVILVNNEKGKDLFDSIKGTLTVYERPLEEASSTNRNIILPSKRPASRNEILNDTKLTTKQLQQKYCRIKPKEKVAHILGYRVVENIKKYIKRSK